MLRTEDFAFTIPAGQMATRPRPHHEHRLLAYHQHERAIAHYQFAELGQALPPDSLLVVNNSKVVRAALKKTPEDGHYIQILNPRETRLDKVAATLSNEVAAGSKVDVVGGQLVIRAVGKGVVTGEIIPADSSVQSLPAFLDAYGVIPLPDYIDEERQTHDLDEADFQACYARVPGSLTCPTAGLHFYPSLIDELKAQGHECVEVTLHIGYGSWDSLQTTFVDEFDLGAEEIIVDVEALHSLRRAKRDGRAVVAVGTTCVRTLESIAPEVWQAEEPETPVHRTTSLFIYPPYEFKVASALLTDFAYPQTPVMTMSAAFCGLDAIKRIYHTALSDGYMFDIFGDALLLA